MKIDLHIHTKTGSDGAMTLEEVFAEAKSRGIGLISISDHDSIDCQEKAAELARTYGMGYVPGVELNVTFEYPGRPNGAKRVSLDLLGYSFAIDNQQLRDKLRVMAEHREGRARQIMENINREFAAEGIPKLTQQDMDAIRESVDGVFGRPHIAAYLEKKGIVKSRQEAFDKYLVKCDVPKYPLSLAEGAGLIRGAGGLAVLAHPNDPNGTSLVGLSRDLDEQTRIIEEHMLPHIDGIECWHSRNDATTTAHYLAFAQRHRLIASGGSDCHQKPVIMGTLEVPDWVADQFKT